MASVTLAAKPMNFDSNCDLRVIRVDFYPKNLHCEFKLPVIQGKITADQVNKEVVELLGMESCNLVYFGLFSGTRYSPVTLYSGKDSLPVDTSQYVFRRISFSMDKHGTLLKHDELTEELICMEIMDEYSKNLVVPILDSTTRHNLSCYIEQGLFNNFWRTLNGHSQCAIIQGFASSQIFRRKKIESLTDHLIALKVGIDLQGMHFFNEKDDTVILSCLWTSITNIRMYLQPEMLFMFDIVVQEKMTRFLRSVIFRTSSCEYLFSLVKYIYNIHEIYPEDYTEGPFQDLKYVKQFKEKENTYQPYILKQCSHRVPFLVYAHEGLSKSVIESIIELSPCYLGKSYPWPQVIYKSNEVSLSFNETEVQTYQIHHYLHWGLRKRESIHENFTKVQVARQPGSPIRVKDVKESVGRNLHLDTGSLKYFSLFITNDSGRRIDILQNSDVMPTTYAGLSFQVVIFNWSRESDNKQWETLLADETATNLIFWEIVAGHGGMIRDVNVLWSKLMFNRTIYELLYALASITDVYSIGNCLLWSDLPPSVVSGKKYITKRQVIVSLDSWGIHLWDPNSGVRIVNWKWDQIIGLKKINIPIPMIVIYFDKIIESDGLTSLSFRTESTGFFYSIGKVLLNNSRHSYISCKEKIGNAKCGEQSKGFKVKFTPELPMCQLAGVGSEHNSVVCINVEDYDTISTTNQSQAGREQLGHKAQKSNELRASSCNSVTMVSKEGNQKPKTVIKSKHDNKPLGSQVQQHEEELLASAHKLCMKLYDEKCMEIKTESSSNLLVPITQVFSKEDKIFLNRKGSLEAIKSDNLSYHTNKQAIAFEEEIKKTHDYFESKVSLPQGSYSHAKSQNQRLTTCETFVSKNIKGKSGISKSDSICPRNQSTSGRPGALSKMHDIPKDYCKPVTKSRMSSLPARTIISPSVSLVTSSEEWKKIYSKEIKNTVIPSTNSTRLPSKNYVNCPESIAGDYIKTKSYQYNNCTVMNIGNEAVASHLDSLLHARASSATIVTACDESESFKDTNEEKGGIKYKLGINCGGTLISSDDCAELEIPRDTVVAEGYRYYRMQNTVKDNHCLMVHNNADLRNVISFSRYSVKSHDSPPPHLRKVISLLSVSAPDSGKYFF